MPSEGSLGEESPASGLPSDVDALPPGSPPLKSVGHPMPEESALSSQSIVPKRMSPLQPVEPPPTTYPRRPIHRIPLLFVPPNGNALQSGNPPSSLMTATNQGGTMVPPSFSELAQGQQIRFTGSHEATSPSSTIEPAGLNQRCRDETENELVQSLGRDSSK